MIKPVFLIVITSISAVANVTDLNVTNKCEGLILKDMVWEKGIDYKNAKEMRFDYSLKNSTDKEISNIKLTIFLKDNSGHRIMESTFAAGKLKPYYAKPMDKGTYYSISPLPDEFTQKADLEVTCSKPNIQNSTIASNEYETIKIKREVFEAIKNHTTSKTNFEAKMEIGMLILLLSKSDSLKKLCGNTKK